MIATVTNAAGVLAMAAPPDQAVSPWIQLIPFALVLGIFYFVILLPMKRRQKKVQEFLDGLKVGDRVVTTGGVIGVITTVRDTSFLIRSADKSILEIARSAIAGIDEEGKQPG